MESAQFPLPHQYIPERWLRDKTKFPLTKDPHPYAYMPFGYGVRTCIGRRFAEMELETLLLTVRKFLFYINLFVFRIELIVLRDFTFEIVLYMFY